MKKNAIVILMIICIFLAALIRYGVIRNETTQESVPVQFLEENSFFHDFEINEETGQVAFRCELTFCNQTDEEQRFAVFANFEIDQERSLLRQGLLQCIEKKTGQEAFVIGPEETICYDVKCIGEYGGNPKKAHRELPEEIVVQLDGQNYTWQKVTTSGQFALKKD